MMVYIGGLAPKYVLDEMQEYEIRPLLDNLYMSHKDDWEAARFISYIVAQCNSTKKLTQQDILKFNWEESKSVDNQMVSMKKRQAIIKQAKEMEKIMFNK